MKAMLSTDGTLLFFCPGCDGHHGIPVTGSRAWQWNQSLESPTITPSILVKQTLYGESYETFDNYEGPHPPTTTKEGICHSYVTDGNIQFLDDCFHKLKGQTVPLLKINVSSL